MRRISTASAKDKARYVFFPGCNVYCQPEKILNALDIMDVIGDDYAFVPGLDSCCGNIHVYWGAVEKADATAAELIDKLASYRPDAVVLWCPTCHCWFESLVARTVELPFEVLSFGQFVAGNLKRLPFNRRIEHTVTLHEACKSVFTGADLTGPREILRQIPGVRLMEMARHGKDTSCCGSGAVTFFPEGFSGLRDERLAEAAQTGADLLVDVCQYCHEVFADKEGSHYFSIVNYVNLVVAAVGIEREDKFKKYKQWGDVKRILEDAVEFIRRSPYPPGLIRSVLSDTFEGGL